MKFEWKILGGFFIAVIILVLLGMYSFRNSREYITTSHVVMHTSDVLFNIERVFAATVEMETNQRGYALTADEDFVHAFNNNSAAVLRRLTALRQLVTDNRQQQLRLDTLESLVNIRTQMSRVAIESTRRWIARRNSTYLDYREDQLPTRDHASLIMNQIRGVVQQMRTEEETLLSARIIANEKQVTEFNQVFVSLMLFIVVLLVAVYITIRFNMKMRLQSEEKEYAFRTLLESSIESQKAVLIHAIDKDYNYLLFNSSHKERAFRAYGVTLALGMNLLDTMRGEDKARVKANFHRSLVGESHVTIEEFGDIERSFFETYYSPILNGQQEIIGATAFSSNITERKRAEEHLRKVTEDLRIANSELDSFCYSVSHDLRAPLRAINGYSRILLEDYSDKLDQDARSLLATVMNNARRMGKLIDDLLNFSQIGKVSLSNVTLYMEKLATDVVEEQLQGMENRVSMNILPLHQSVGDPGMIKQVWTNLVSNAVKYSSKIDSPKIEIGSRKENGSIIYYVQDNGVGFDMTYAHKLFGVFQRLHKSADFEGTGVGLSIINRIILRHGGKVWAEGAPNGGATFYFSLPTNN